MLRVLRDITGGARIDIDTRSRTITMRDTPERLALAGQLIEQLERAAVKLCWSSSSSKSIAIRLALLELRLRLPNTHRLEYQRPE